MHARASFKIKDFNKDYHPLGDHACAKRMIKGEALDCFPKGNHGNFSEFLSILKKKE